MFKKTKVQIPLNLTYILKHVRNIPYRGLYINFEL